jgi:hypothetical protein
MDFRSDYFRTLAVRMQLIAKMLLMGFEQVSARGICHRERTCSSRQTRRGSKSRPMGGKVCQGSPAFRLVEWLRDSLRANNFKATEVSHQSVCSLLTGRDCFAAVGSAFLASALCWGSILLRVERKADTPGSRRTPERGKLEELDVPTQAVHRTRSPLRKKWASSFLEHRSLHALDGRMLYGATGGQGERRLLVGMSQLAVPNMVLEERKMQW